MLKMMFLKNVIFDIPSEPLYSGSDGGTHRWIAVSVTLSGFGPSVPRGRIPGRNSEVPVRGLRVYFVKIDDLSPTTPSAVDGGTTHQRRVPEATPGK